ncbi:hypothetical protein [Haloarcula litorea]|uniref:hypothetical protein n=1 Tax=Haloarcula litorea TaxID=3032579 RepID=UPI0023E7AC30|nr:hypothetical protein [Halomicroarcula sp. GDY20]
MSLTPADETRGSTSDATPAPASDASLGERLRAGVRSALGRLPGGDRALAWYDAREADGPDPETMADDAVTPPDCPAVPELPQREEPLTYPDRNRDTENDPDLVSTHRNQQLTVSHPDNPDATITSDTWERVEP